MANVAENKGIKNSWSLISFAKAFGKPQLGEFTNKETGEQFNSCIFTNPEDQSKTFVAFSSKLSIPQTVKGIVDNKDNLQVVELESGSYVLCMAGQNSWQDIDLGL